MLSTIPRTKELEGTPYFVLYVTFTSASNWSDSFDGRISPLTSLVLRIYYIYYLRTRDVQFVDFFSKVLSNFDLEASGDISLSLILNKIKGKNTDDKVIFFLGLMKFRRHFPLTNLQMNDLI